MKPAGPGLCTYNFLVRLAHSVVVSRAGDREGRQVVSSGFREGGNRFFNCRARGETENLLWPFSRPSPREGGPFLQNSHDPVTKRDEDGVVRINPRLAAIPRHRSCGTIQIHDETGERNIWMRETNLPRGESDRGVMQVSCYETIVTVEVKAVFARGMRLPCETRDCANLHDVALWSRQFKLEIPWLEIPWVCPLLEGSRFNLRSVYVELEMMVRKEHRVCRPEVRFHAIHFSLRELDAKPREVDA